MLQSNPHTPPLHVAIVALAGTGHGTHDVPHEFTLVSLKQFPLHSCVPLGQLPLQALFSPMHVPKQSFCPLGHWPPQDVPSQVALPPNGGEQGVQDMLQLSTLVLLTHASEQT